jgi:uncharacterized spore protein YtfJ
MTRSRCAVSFLEGVETVGGPWVCPIEGSGGRGAGASLAKVAVVMVGKKGVAKCFLWTV